MGDITVLEVTVKLTQIIVPIVIILGYQIGALIAFEERDDGAGCAARPDKLFNQMFVFAESVFYTIIGPCLLIIFGSLTIYNVSRTGNNRTNNSQHRRTETELVRMLIIQVSSHLLLGGPFCAMYLAAVLPTPFRSTLQLYVAITLAKILLYMGHGSPFFLYILAGRIYRRELVRLVRKLLLAGVFAALTARNTVTAVQTAAQHPSNAVVPVQTTTV